jgi:hypothetical protein
MNEEMMELLNRLMAKDEGSRQPYVEEDAIVLNSPYQKEILNQVMSNISVPPQFKGGKGMRPEDALMFYNRFKDQAQKQIERKYLGESKSIDDIINQSDIAEFLSKAIADKINVDSRDMPMKTDITKYSSDDPIDLLFKMKDNQRRKPSDINDLIKILEDLGKAKPVIS